MSIVVSKVAEPYAEALLSLAKANGTMKETTNDMNIVSQFLANSSDLKKFLANPVITREAKKNIVELAQENGFTSLAMASHLDTVLLAKIISVKTSGC